jgi:Helix-turn-helix domain
MAKSDYDVGRSEGSKAGLNRIERGRGGAHRRLPQTYALPARHLPGSPKAEDPGAQPFGASPMSTAISGSRIPSGLANKPPKFDLGRPSAHFTIEICALPGGADDYLYAAINQTQFVFAKVMNGASPYDATEFLEDLRKNAPAGVSSVLTSDHKAFGHPAGEPWQPKFPHRIHPFVKACRASHIGRLVEKSSSSGRTMVMKGWRDVALKVRKAGGRRRSVIGLRTDFDVQTVMSFAEELMDRPQARGRLLAMAAILDGATRTEAAKIAGVTAQTIRDWVMRFNVDGPDSLLDHREGLI